MRGCQLVGRKPILSLTLAMVAVAIWRALVAPTASIRSKSSS
jgi:hypothetical protein